MIRRKSESRRPALRIAQPHGPAFVGEPMNRIAALTNQRPPFVRSNLIVNGLLQPVTPSEPAAKPGESRPARDRDAP